MRMMKFYGRSYVHILPTGREQEWLATISNAVHMAKRQEHVRKFDEQFVSQS
jgi:hypothetical protein